MSGADVGRGRASIRDVRGERFRVEQMSAQGGHEIVDEVAIEQPLEVRVRGTAPWVTMRTPGHDIDLSLGWLVSEGVIVEASNVLEARERSVGLGVERSTSVEIYLRPEISPPMGRSYPASSSCGVCGSDSVKKVVESCHSHLSEVPTCAAGDWLAGAPEQMRLSQEGFRRTGGLHAAALFDAASGNTIVVREDVGRHNAVDKVVGWALREQLLPGHQMILQVSSRASFEIVQKAAMAGIPILSAVSAPTSMAVDLARAVGITLACFVRGTSFNVYSRGDRIKAWGHLC